MKHVKVTITAAALRDGLESAQPAGQ
jgi:hypothetical protein